jgi:hypothetical protein
LPDSKIYHTVVFTIPAHPAKPLPALIGVLQIKAIFSPAKWAGSNIIRPALFQCRQVDDPANLLHLVHFFQVHAPLPSLFATFLACLIISSSFFLLRPLKTMGNLGNHRQPAAITATLIAPAVFQPFRSLRILTAFLFNKWNSSTN